jgi:hypothetical protein
MSALITSCLVLACLVACLLIGMALQRPVPDAHLSADSKDIVKLGIGLVATLSALVLGLMIASAKSTHDTARAEVYELAADVLLLDRILAYYGGPGAAQARGLLRQRATLALERVWPSSDTMPVEVKNAWAANVEAMFSTIQYLTPATEVEHSLQTQALQINMAMAKSRFMLIESARGSIPQPFIVVMVAWVSIIFASFGLFSPRNMTVIIILFLCAVSVSGALFLVLELDTPFEGIVRVSDAPLRDAIARIGS